MFLVRADFNSHLAKFLNLTNSSHTLFQHAPDIPVYSCAHQPPRLFSTSVHIQSPLIHMSLNILST